jgi:hypothetical protein
VFSRPALVRLALLRRVAIALLGVGVLFGVARAGHEITFYPSFYPQEITLTRLDPAAAARALETTAIQAYLGADPFAGRSAPETVQYVPSLGSFVVLTFDAARPTFRDAATRCAAVARVQQALVGSSGIAGDFVAHAYPVTPFHPDWLTHYDLAQAAAERVTTSASAAPILRVKAPARFAEALARAGVIVGERDADAVLEELDTERLRGAAAGTPWPKAGWFQSAQIYLMPGERGPERSVTVELLARRERGRFATPAERADVERQLVTALVRDCARAPVGYLVRRQAYSAEYSNGVENVAWDSQSGLRSAMFLRTVKLKDFPWNGWLTVGMASTPAAAWNPVAGFTDAPGRAVWDAVADPAFLPMPYADGWLPNRVQVSDVQAGPVEIPANALVPDRETGVLRPADRRATATAKITYRVLASKFHDGTAMSRVDLLAPYAFALRWAKRDREVERATARLRERLAAVRVVRIDTEVKEFGEVQLVHKVPLVEVYLRGEGDPAVAFALVAPWSAVPWELLTLMDEVVARGWATFSEAEAQRRGVPWLDLVRDPRAKARLATLAQDLERRAFVPVALRIAATPDDARPRWAALRRFAREQGHYLIANGPYRLGKVTTEAIVLPVFRDFTYPIGVGAFDRWSLPLRAYMTGIDVTPTGLALRVDVERVEKAARSYEIVRQPFSPEVAGGGVTPPPPVAHYVVIGADGHVAAAGTSDRVEQARVLVPLSPLPRGEYRVFLAVTLGDNLVNPDVKVMAWTRS